MGSAAHQLPRAAGPLMVSQIMTTDVSTVTRDQLLRDVRRVMLRQKIRRVPVVTSDNRLIGLITKSIVLSAQRGKKLDLAERSAATLMEQDVIVAHPTDTAAHAAQLMLAHKVGCVPVVTPARKELIGIITQSDFVRAFVRAAARHG